MRTHYQYFFSHLILPIYINQKNFKKHISQTASTMSKDAEKVNNTASDSKAAAPAAEQKNLGLVKSGRVWKETNKKPLRINAIGLGRKSWEKKKEERLALEAFKAKNRELKQEKEDERKRKVEERKERLKQKEEKERYDMLAKKMHAKVSSYFNPCLLSLLLLSYIKLTGIHYRKSRDYEERKSATKCSKSDKWYLVFINFYKSFHIIHVS